MKTKNRLSKTLHQVLTWAEDIQIVRGQRYHDYMNGGGLAVLANIDLFKYGMAESGKSLTLAIKGAHSEACLHMAQAFRRLAIADMLGIHSKIGTGRFIIGDPDTVTHTMLGAIATGQPELVPIFHQTLFDGIAGGYGMRDGHHIPLGTTLRYAAFGLTIIGDWLGKPLDLDKHALPRDPAWGQLVAHWREPDPEKFLPVILAACDTHVERIALTEKEDDSGHFEFGSVFLAVHPTEILAVLRLRDMLGLPNPAYIDHPLMQSPYAAITCLPGDVTERDELLENFLAVVRQRDPQVLPISI